MAKLTTRYYKKYRTIVRPYPDKARTKMLFFYENVGVEYIHGSNPFLKIFGG